MDWHGGSPLVIPEQFALGTGLDFLCPTCEIPDCVDGDPDLIVRSCCPESVVVIIDPPGRTLKLLPCL